jgi:hypothetical protein
METQETQEFVFETEMVTKVARAYELILYTDALNGRTPDDAIRDFLSTGMYQHQTDWYKAAFIEESTASAGREELTDYWQDL